MHLSQVRNTTFLLIGSLSLLIGGCAGYLGDQAPVPEEKILTNFTGKVYQIGSVPGVLAEEMAAAFTFTPYSDGLTDGPIILSGETLGTLTEAQRTGLAGAYAGNQPILLFHATADQINALRQVLGVTISTFVMPEGMERVEVYALDREPDHEVWQYIQYPPQQEQVDPDDPNDQKKRVSDLIDWLDDNQVRKTLAEQETTSTLPTAKEAEVNQLTQLASAFIDQRNFSEFGNRYQVSHFIYSFHSIVTGEDWFYIQQQGIFNGSGAYGGKKLNNKTQNNGEATSWYMDTIDINTFVKEFKGNSADVGLLNPSPQTANNEEKVSSSISYDVGGDVSLDTGGPSGKLKGGVSVSNSRSFKVQDVTVNNLCLDDFNNAHWVYAFKRCTTNMPFLVSFLVGPPELSVSSFQPVNQWIWRFSPDVRKQKPNMHVTFRVNLVSTVAHTYPLIPWITSADHSPLIGTLFEYDLALPVPPVE